MCMIKLKFDTLKHVLELYVYDLSVRHSHLTDPIMYVNTVYEEAKKLFLLSKCHQFTLVATTNSMDKRKNIRI